MMRASFLILFTVMVFKVRIEGSILVLAVVMAVYAAISIGLGMILSCLVRTEQQFMALAMLVSMPSMFLAGVFFPIRSMPQILQILANFLPITYAGSAFRSVMIKGLSFHYILLQFNILLIFLALIMVLLFTVFKRDIE
jgi:ABC-2 type transport system permease protein